MEILTRGECVETAIKLFDLNEVDSIQIFNIIKTSVIITSVIITSIMMTSI